MEQCSGDDDAAFGAGKGGTMSAFKFLLGAALLAGAWPASAQATRTWVSGVGDDVNPCSRTAPCKTFAGAISKTAAGGEINCLDPGGFGTVTITKSLTIDCTGTFGSTLNSGGINGIVVNDSLTAAPNTIEVLLRGLSIDGAGTTAGLNGIRLIAGRSLVVEDVFIQNEAGQTGIAITPGGAAEFYAENVTVTDGSTGIHFRPTGAGGSVRAVLRNVRAQNNSANGLNIDTSGNTAPAGIIIAVDKSSFTGNSSGIALSALAATTTATVMVTDSVVANNSAAGLSATGPLARIRVGGSSITGNGIGVSATAGASINTYASNQLDGNSSDGSFTLPAIPEE
ncbi:MAG: hypothetical protein ACJ8D6_09750 [Sphingomicrobium sp.]